MSELDPNLDPNKDPNKNPEVTLPTTPEELAKLLQAETDKRVTGALQTAKAKWEAEFNIKLENEKQEAARLAKLSAAEREKAEFDKQKAEFEKQRAEFTKTQMLNQTMLELQKESLPVNFAEYMVGESAEKTLEKINAFKDVWQEALQKAVDERLKGKSPKTGSDSGTLTKEEFNKMGYKERIALMASNPVLYAELSKR